MGPSARIDKNGTTLWDCSMNLWRKKPRGNKEDELRGFQEMRNWGCLHYCKGGVNKKHARNVTFLNRNKIIIGKVKEKKFNWLFIFLKSRDVAKYILE